MQYHCITFLAVAYGQCISRRSGGMALSGMPCKGLEDQDSRLACLMGPSEVDVLAITDQACRVLVGVFHLLLVVPALAVHPNGFRSNFGCSESLWLAERDTQQQCQRLARVTHTG
jgi:hypothetical protein